MNKWQIPDDWQWKTLSEICDINPRRPRLVRDDDAPTSFVPMEDVDEKVGQFRQIRVKAFGEIKRGYTYFEENDVLYAKITPSMENGKTAIARGLIDGYGFGTTEFHVFRPHPAILPEYIHFYIRREPFRQEAKEHFRGAVGQQRVPQDFLIDYPVPLPYPDDPARSLAEQRRIVARIEALLAEVGEMRKLQGEIGRDTDQLMDAVRTEQFYRNAPLPDGWERRRLDSVADINPRRPQIVREDTVLTSFVPMAFVDEVRGDFSEIDAKPYSEVRRGFTYFEENDVVFAKITPSMQNGKSAVARNLIDGFGFGTTEFHVIRSRGGVLPDWIHQFVRQKYFLTEAMGHFRGAVGQQRVPPEFLASYEIPVPFPEDEEKSLTMQRLLIQQMKAIQTEVWQMQNDAKEESVLLESMEQAILAQAFRGEL